MAMKLPCSVCGKTEKFIIAADGSKFCGNCGNEWHPGLYGESKVILNKGDQKRNRELVAEYWEKKK